MFLFLWHITPVKAKLPDIFLGQSVFFSHCECMSKQYCIECLIYFTVVIIFQKRNQRGRGQCLAKKQTFEIICKVYYMSPATLPVHALRPPGTCSLEEGKTFTNS